MYKCLATYTLQQGGKGVIHKARKMNEEEGKRGDILIGTRGGLADSAIINYSI